MIEKKRMLLYGAFMKKILFLIFASCFAFSHIFCDDPPPSSTPEHVAYPNLVGRPELSTFRDLVIKAGLWNFFQAPGPYTLFAPNNSAFEKMDQKKLAELKKPENRDALADFVNYHVIMGKYVSKNLKDTEYRTINGKNVTVHTKDGHITVNNANVIQADIEGPNGVGYIIDQPLIP
jgi:uncharacterized surface protein with fasciclin (FAS1) repeats